MAEPIYLDYNSTAPIDPRVVAAMQQCYALRPANPAGQHGPGRQARRLVEQARASVARIVGAETEGMDADRLIFTGSATEANNWLLRGLAGSPPGKLAISAIEHPSIEDTARLLQRQGHEVLRIPVDRRGTIRLDVAGEMIQPGLRVVSVMLANNETGVLQPVERLAALCRRAGVPLHTDAAQAVGRVPVSFRGLDVDAMTFTSHKCHGPRGIGALLLRTDVRLEPLLVGGFQQSGLRAGTEPVALPVGFAQALQLWHDDAEQQAARLEQLRDRLEADLLSAAAETVIHGREAPRLPQTCNIAFPGVDRQALLMALDQEGIACSTGSACASGSSEPSPVLRAMGCDEASLRSAIRLSWGAETTAGELSEAARRIMLCVNRLRPRK